MVEKRAIIILSIVLFFVVSSTLTGIARFLDTVMLDQCGKELCLTVRTNRGIYTLRECLGVDVFISNNGVKEYKGYPSIDMEIYNASQALMRSRSTSVSDGGRGFILVPGRKVNLNAQFDPPLSLPLSLTIEGWGDKPFHPGIFTIIVTCRHPEYVLEGNTTFTIL